MGRQYNQEHRSTFVPGWGFPTSFNYKTSASQKSKISTENPPRSTYSQKNNSLNNDQPSPRTSSSTASDNTLDKAFASDSERRASATMRSGYSSFSDQKAPLKKNKAVGGISASGNPSWQDFVERSTSKTQEPRTKSSKPLDHNSNKHGQRNNNLPSKVLLTPISAEKESLRGDAFFEAKKFKVAKEFYTRAINILFKNNSDRMLLLNKRATALIRLGEFEECLQDCEKVVKLAHRSIHIKQPTTPLISKASSSFQDQLIKALTNKAEALNKLEKYRDAITVYQKIISKDNTLHAAMSRHIMGCTQSLKAQGDSFFKQEKFKDAEKAYTETITVILPKTNGDLVLLLSNRAASLMMQQQYMECLKDCNAAIDLVCTHIKSKMATSLLLKNSGNTMETILITLLYRKARALQALERYHAAIEAYRTILYFDRSQDKRIAKDHEQCKAYLYWEQGNTYYINNDLKEAEASCTNAITMLSENHPDSIPFLNNRADIFAVQGKYRESLADCMSINKLASNSINNGIHHTTFMKATQTTITRQLRRSLHRQQASFIELYKCQGVLINIDSILSSIIPGDPQLMEIATSFTSALYKEQGNQFYKKGQYTDAIKSYTRAIHFLPADSNYLFVLLNNRAAASLLVGRHASCLDDCNRGIMLAYNNIDENIPITFLTSTSKTTFNAQLVKLYFRQAQAFEALGEYQQAADAYGDSLSLSKYKSAQAKEGIRRCMESSYKVQGDSHYINDRLAEAQKCYTRGINTLPKKHPDLINLYSSRAAVYMKLGDYPKCLEDCKSAIVLAYSKKRDIETKLQLASNLRCKAEALIALKKYQAAIIAYEEIMDIMKNNYMMHRVKLCQDLLEKQMKEELEAKTSKRVKEMREREKQMKAEKDERAAKEQMVTEKISTWKDGKNDLRALLCSLDSILWPEVLVKGVKIDSSSSKAHCKKVYMKVIAKIHDDKLPHTITVEQRLLANRVFQVLNESYNEFRI